jgi:hypothetical protein
MTNGWHREWLCKPHDLEMIEKHDLLPLVKARCAWLVRDTRRDIGTVLVETLADITLPRTVYYREYVIFLESGLWWRVPRVHIRLVYDLRGLGKLDISQADFQALYATYFPGTRHETAVVEGLEAELHRVLVRP